MRDGLTNVPRFIECDLGIKYPSYDGAREAVAVWEEIDRTEWCSVIPRDFRQILGHKIVFYTVDALHRQCLAERRRFGNGFVSDSRLPDPDSEEDE